MAFTHPENVIINQPSPFTGRLLDVQLAGSSKAYIDQDGNVAIGMGSNAPAKIVSIGSPNPNGVAVHSLGNSWMGFQVHRGPLASDEKWFIGLGDTAAYGNKLLLRRAASTNDIVIDENGNVGIGTASPGAKLDVAGDLKVAGGFGNTGLTVEEATKGTIKTNGNLWVLRSGGDSDPTLWYLGREELQGSVPAHTNYFFWQNRLNKNGWWWSGWNTFRHPATVKDGDEADVAWGYGYYPFRNMAKNYLLEADGVIVTDNVFVGPKVYFQKPDHIDIIGELIEPPPPELPHRDYKQRQPSGYDSDRHPFYDLGFGTAINMPGGVPAGTDPITVDDASQLDVDDEIFINGGATNSEINVLASKSGNTLTLGRDHKAYADDTPVRKVRELGGVQPDPSSDGLGVYITRNVNDLFFRDLNNTGGVTLIQLARQVDGMRIQHGASSTDNGGDATVALSGFASSPTFIVSCRHTDFNYTVGGRATSPTSASVVSWNQNHVKTGNISFDWIAIGPAA